MKLSARAVLIYAAVALALAGAAAMYLSPHLMIDLAARVWACF
jgi:hypothetical protein